MKRVYSHIKSLINMALAFFMLLSLSGFQLYTHQCTSQNIKNVSVLIPAEPCGHAHQSKTTACCEVKVEQVCCEVKVEQVCSEVKVEQACSEAKQASTNEDTDCCSDEQIYVRLKTDSVLNYVSPKIETVSFELLYWFIGDFRPCYCLLNKELITQSAQESPPPLSLSEHLSFIQVYII